MNKTKETFVFGFALFAGFFGAGNLILPPMLGFKSGSDWWLVTVGFVISATLIPLLALLGHAKLQGTLYDFGKKVSHSFSMVFLLIIYVICIVLPSPRTAAVTHEMAIAPFFGTSALLTSIIYFTLVFLFVLNRNKVLNIIGKYLTPIIAIILLAIIYIGIFSANTEMISTSFNSPIISGLLEGYQTYDAIGAMVMGGVIIVTINNSKSTLTFAEKKTMIAKSGMIAVTGLLLIYGGLIAVGAFFNTQFDVNISRAELLSGISLLTLGKLGTAFLSVLVGLACFTTAVSIIVSIADFFTMYFKKFKNAYLITSFICCSAGILIGQMKVEYIINVALPALMIIYPLCIVLIILNVLPEKFASKLVFKWVVLITFIFSIPDFLGFLMPLENLNSIKAIIPLANENLGWVLPALLTFILVNLIKKLKAKN
ncbi:MAG: branched-chain amino acid transport system II carrier protein [Flaviramulus sp.]|nr:branched-chain amino acid transport system II carrier protein [Flaviramulus sp.]NNC49922.1 branched-chain amino acid transport system II carrier protein [Flaviramulus sp.]